MKRMRLFSLAAMAALFLGASAQQTDEVIVIDGVPVNQTTMRGWTPKGNPDWSLMEDGNLKRGLKEEIQLPDHVHNGETEAFPIVFNQAGGSCGPSSRIGYMLTHELNAYRHVSGKLDENRLPPNFVYPFSYNGDSKDQLAKFVGVPNMKVYGGFPYSSIYGFCEANGEGEINRGGWMQGYDKWFHAMHNRLESTSNFPESCYEGEGMKAVKRWLFNHNGDESFAVGGILGLGCAASGMGLATIPTTAANTKAGVSGKQYLEHFGEQVDHAITLVGWDDRVEFDLDKNGKVGEEKNGLGQCEVGAWIIVNSWGNWGNGGFAYVPYAMCGPTSKSQTHNGKSVYVCNNKGWWPEIYRIRKDYVPQRTIKLKMTYTQRSLMSLSAGISKNLKATKPEQSVTFHHFNYQGDPTGKNPDMPMLGKWNDNKIHGEAMEFGYDLTDLSNGFDQGQPLKYFFTVTTKSGAKGKGGIHAASIIDYAINQDGIETPFEIVGDSVDILNGKSVTITVIVNGESFAAPNNLSVDEKGELSWSAPMGGGRTPKAYRIFADDKQIAEVSTTTYKVAGVKAGVRYTVKAVYDIDGQERVSKASNPAVLAVAGDGAVDNIVGVFENGGFSIPDVFANSYPEATIEYRIKPNKLSDWNQQIGPNWGQFLIHANSSGQLDFGWNTGERGQASGVLKNNSWMHIAIVISGNVATLYTNGVKKTSVTASSYSGIGGFGNFEFGSHSSASNALYGQIDEVRIWGEARTAAQVRSSYQYPLLNPTQYSSLLAYYKMDTIEENGETKFRDCVGGHHASFIGKAESKEVSATGFRSSMTLSAKIVKPGTVTVGVPVTFNEQCSPNAVKRVWTIEGKQYSVSNPTVVFMTEGEKTAILNVSDPEGNTDADTLVFSVSPCDVPTADFIKSSESIKGDERISFVSRNVVAGCSYLWEMPGADVPKATTVNASATYSKEGKYNVKLTVTAPDGKKYSSSQSFTVTATAPVPRFNIPNRIVVRGETVNLHDNSAYSPTAARWVFTSPQSVISTIGLNSTIVPTAAGVYSLNYKVSNQHGCNETEVPGVLTVCNADSKQGLNFANSNQKLTASAPKNITDQWSMDFWFRPQAVGAGTLGIGGGKNGFTLTNDAEGRLTLKAGSASVKTAAGFIKSGEWHHYAVTFNNGTVTFFLDGTKESSEKLGDVTDMSSYWKGLTIGGSGCETNGIIDELRVFNKVLYQASIRKYCVAPMNDVIAETDKANLVLYYDFNHSTGNAVDRSGNGLTGVRSGFGPDGDAWVDSKGVFALNFGTKQTVTPFGQQIKTTSGYSVVECSDEETSKEKSPAKNVIDNNVNTFWHSRYSTTTPYPHSVTLKRTSPVDIETIELSYLAARGTNYRASEMMVEASTDGNNWTLVEDAIVLPDAENHYVTLLRPVETPYVRFTFTKGHGAFLALSEIRLYGGMIATGIEEIKPAEEFVPAQRRGMFDLQGRRLNQAPKHGLYILNGRKVMAK